MRAPLLMLAIGAGLSMAPAHASDAPDEPTAGESTDSPLTWEVSGTFRVRGHMYGANSSKKQAFGALYDGQADAGTFLQQRLRLGIAARYEDLASLNLHLQGMDDILWGDNADYSSTALFAADPSYTDRTGMEQSPDLRLFRAWVETRLPIGLLRVGRQSSHWGMGLLANHGDGFDDDFGENYFGNTFDRVLFGTNPVSIAQALTGHEGPEIPLTFAVAVDRLVEDPLTQFYGYACTVGVRRDSDPDRYDRRCDMDGDGVTDLDHGYAEERVATDRTNDWWADPEDDVWEMVYALIYQGEDLDFMKGGHLTAGTYVINRLQAETDSNVVIADLFVDAASQGVELELEAVSIFGKTRGIVLPDSSQNDPLKKEAQILGYASRLSYGQDTWRVLAETGFASGDDQVNDGAFTGRPLHPDYNVGLLLYEEVLAHTTAQIWGDSARGLWSNGGVYNSQYINPRVYLYPAADTEIVTGFLMAWPHKPDGAILRCTEDEVNDLACALAQAEEKPLGWEIDVKVQQRWAKHLLASIEAGYAEVTDRVPLDIVGLNPKGEFFTLQSRIGWEF